MLQNSFGICLYTRIVYICAGEVMYGHICLQHDHKSGLWFAGQPKVRVPAESCHISLVLWAAVAQYGSLLTYCQRLENDYFKYIFSNEKAWISTEVHSITLLEIQLIIIQHWLGPWLGTEQATGHYLK